MVEQVLDYEKDTNKFPKLLKEFFDKLKLSKYHNKNEVLKEKVREALKLLPKKNTTVLPALSSNNLAFEIFKYLDQPLSFIHFRSLSRKSMEKSIYLHNYSNPIVFKGKMLEYFFIFD